MACMPSGVGLHLPGLAVQAEVEPVADLLALALGHAEHAGDDLDRERRREVGDGVERVGVLEGRRGTRVITSRTIGSRAVTARGVNTRLTSARSRSCSGGSIMMMLRKLRITSGSFDSVDRSTPCALENALQSRWAATTSAKRDRA